MATTIDLEKLRKGWGNALSDAAQKIQTAQAAQENAGQKKPTGGTSGGTAATGSDIVSQYPASTVYDKDTDYMKLMQDAIARGDYGAAARYEQQRNSKITGEGLDSSLYTDYYSQYLPENRYKYDPTQNEEYMKWRDQQNALYEQIMNRDPFEYNAEADPLYQQYKTQYTQLGQNAMRDTMGQAAALTGGYGSTYSQQAGQQAYDAYLQRLNDVLPELYGDAYQRYQNEGNNLLAQYNMAYGRAEDEYNRDYSNWQTQLGLQREDEANAYNRWLAQQETEYAKQQDNRNYLLSIISATGYNPTDAELQAAGMTRAEANALIQEYQRELAAASFSSGGGGSSGRSSGGSSRRSSGGGGSDYGVVELDDAGTEQKREEAYNNCVKSLEATAHGGGTRAQMLQQISNWVSSGYITKEQADALVKKYGLDQETGSVGGGKGGASGGGKTSTRGEY